MEKRGREGCIGMERGKTGGREDESGREGPGEGGGREGGREGERIRDRGGGTVRVISTQVAATTNEEARHPSQKK